MEHAQSLANQLNENRLMQLAEASDTLKALEEKFTLVEEANKGLISKLAKAEEKVTPTGAENAGRIAGPSPANTEESIKALQKKKKGVHCRECKHWTDLGTQRTRREMRDDERSK